MRVDATIERSIINDLNPLGVAWRFGGEYTKGKPGIGFWASLWRAIAH